MKARHRATLYAGLAELLRSGLGWERALTGIGRDLPGGLPARTLAAASACRDGVPPGEAGRLCGLWDELDARLLCVGSRSGREDDVLSRLARWYGLGAICQHKLAARLWMPGFVLLLAALAQPLPALLARDITGPMYLAASARSLLGWSAVLVVAYLFVGFLIAPRRAAAASEWLRERLPMRRYLDTLRARRFTFALETALEAGLAGPDAMELAAGTIVHPRARARAAAAVGLARDGRPFFEALRAADVLGHRADRELLRIADATGDPAAMLSLRRASLEQDAERQCESLAEWLPRIFYIAAVTWFVL